MKKKIIIFSDGSASLKCAKLRLSILTTKKKILKHDLIAFTAARKQKRTTVKSSNTMTRYKNKYVT